MAAPLRIALLCPHVWPPRDDVGHHVAAEAAALARRGHRVTILAPATGRERVARGRALLAAAAHRGGGAELAPEGPGVLEVGIRRAALPGALEQALATGPWDIVHLHEPLAASPALAALRHSRAATVVTFHRAEPLEGVTLLRPLLERALSRTRVRLVTSAATRTVLEDVLPGDYAEVAPGADAPLPAPSRAGPPPLTLVARSRDRVGVRFALSVLAGLDVSALGAITLVGPAEAPWRTRAAVPKALRSAVAVLPDAGPAARSPALAGVIAVLADPSEAAGPVLGEAQAGACVVLAPRSPAAEARVRHGVDGLVLPPFSRDSWSAAIDGLLREPERRRALAAAARARSRSWDDAAAELEARYREALGVAPRPARPRVRADLRVRMGPALGPDALLAACRARDVGLVAVASPDGIGPALAVRDRAPDDVRVIVGQEVATADGPIVGLFLAEDVPGGLELAQTAAAIHAQGGLVMVPDPLAPGGAPEAAALRALGAGADLHEMRDPAGWEALRRIGLLPCAGSGAERPREVGARLTEIALPDGPAALLAALADARAPGPRRRRRAPAS